jgi:hypothetical protein
MISMEGMDDDIFVSTRIHLYIVLDVSPVPINLYVRMNKLKGGQMVQTQDDIS